MSITIVVEGERPGGVIAFSRRTIGDYKQPVCNFTFEDELIGIGLDFSLLAFI